MGHAGGTLNRMSEIEEFYPRLVVDGADAALSFYTKVFDAEVTERFDDGAGRVHHAMVVAGPARFAVKDAGDGDPAPSEGGVPVILALYVADPDALAQRMIDGGARVIYPVVDHDYGDRAGRLADPWGHLWMVAKQLAEHS
ncbi:MAG: PhnB protein [Pseudonocardiales bacterium]|nr:PhnB protein [Pseudonocardiales bacterium]